MPNNATPAWKWALLGFGVGIVLTLVVARTGSTYVRNLIVENAQQRLTVPHPTSPSAMEFPSPELPGEPLLPVQQYEQWTFRSLDGRRATLAAMRGKPVFLNVWKTSCAPCLAELPGIEQLAASLGDNAANFVLLALDDEATVRKAVGSNRDLPVYVADPRTTPGIFINRGVPQTYILDRTGNVAFHGFGAANWDTDGARAYLRRLAQ